MLSIELIGVLGLSLVMAVCAMIGTVLKRANQPSSHAQQARGVHQVWSLWQGAGSRPPQNASSATT